MNELNLTELKPFVLQNKILLCNSKLVIIPFDAAPIHNNYKTEICPLKNDWFNGKFD